MTIKKIEGCRLFACKNKETGEIELKPEGCSADEALMWIQEMQSQPNINIDLRGLKKEKK
jgi:hypothetical protein